MAVVVPSAFLERMASLFQFARPAVELSFLLQIIWMPPVEAASDDTWLFAIVSSSSLRKDTARSCFFSLKAFFCSIASLSFFAGVLKGLFRGELLGEISFSFSSSSEKRRLDRGVFFGEYWSFQSLMTSWLQKASMLGL